MAPNVNTSNGGRRSPLRTIKPAAAAAHVPQHRQSDQLESSSSMNNDPPLRTIPTGDIGQGFTSYNVSGNGSSLPSSSMSSTSFASASRVTLVNAPPITNNFYASSWNDNAGISSHRSHHMFHNSGGSSSNHISGMGGTGWHTSSMSSTSLGSVPMRSPSPSSALPAPHFRVAIHSPSPPQTLLTIAPPLPLSTASDHLPSVLVNDAGAGNDDGDDDDSDDNDSISGSVLHHGYNNDSGSEQMMSSTKKKATRRGTKHRGRGGKPPKAKSVTTPPVDYQYHQSSKYNNQSYHGHHRHHNNTNTGDHSSNNNGYHNHHSTNNNNNHNNRYHDSEHSQQQQRYNEIVGRRLVPSSLHDDYPSNRPPERSHHDAHVYHSTPSSTMRPPSPPQSYHPPIVVKTEPIASPVADDAALEAMRMSLLKGIKRKPKVVVDLLDSTTPTSSSNSTMTLLQPEHQAILDAVVAGVAVEEAQATPWQSIILPTNQPTTPPTPLVVSSSATISTSSSSTSSLLSSSLSSSSVNRSMATAIPAMSPTPLPSSSSSVPITSSILPVPLPRTVSAPIASSSSFGQTTSGASSQAMAFLSRINPQPQFIIPLDSSGSDDDDDDDDTGDVDDPSPRANGSNNDGISPPLGSSLSSSRRSRPSRTQATSVSTAMPLSTSSFALEAARLKALIASREAKKKRVLQQRLQHAAAATTTTASTTSQLGQGASTSNVDATQRRSQSPLPSLSPPSSPDNTNATLNTTPLVASTPITTSNSNTDVAIEVEVASTTPPGSTTSPIAGVDVVRQQLGDVAAQKAKIEALLEQQRQELQSMLAGLAPEIVAALMPTLPLPIPILPSSSPASITTIPSTSSSPNNSSNSSNSSTNTDPLSVNMSPSRKRKSASIPSSLPSSDSSGTRVPSFTDTDGAIRSNDNDLEQSLSPSSPKRSRTELLVIPSSSNVDDQMTLVSPSAASLSSNDLVNDSSGRHRYTPTTIITDINIHNATRTTSSPTKSISAAAARRGDGGGTTTNNIGNSNRRALIRSLSARVELLARSKRRRSSASSSSMKKSASTLSSFKGSIPKKSRSTPTSSRMDVVVDKATLKRQLSDRMKHALKRRATALEIKAMARDSHRAVIQRRQDQAATAAAVKHGMAALRMGTSIKEGREGLKERRKAMVSLMRSASTRRLLLNARTKLNDKLKKSGIAPPKAEIVRTGGPTVARTKRSKPHGGAWTITPLGMDDLIGKGSNNMKKKKKHNSSGATDDPEDYTNRKRGRNDAHNDDLQVALSSDVHNETDAGLREPHFGLTEYISPLHQFRSYRLSAHYRLPLSSTTLSNRCEPFGALLCRDDLLSSKGCVNPKCEFLHIGSVSLSTPDLLTDLARYQKSSQSSSSALSSSNVSNPSDLLQLLRDLRQVADGTVVSSLAPSVDPRVIAPPPTSSSSSSSKRPSSKSTLRHAKATSAHGRVYMQRKFGNAAVLSSSSRKHRTYIAPSTPKSKPIPLVSSPMTTTTKVVSNAPSSPPRRTAPRRYYIEKDATTPANEIDEIDDDDESHVLEPSLPHRVVSSSQHVAIAPSSDTNDEVGINDDATETSNDEDDDEFKQIDLEADHIEDVDDPSGSSEIDESNENDSNNNVIVNNESSSIDDLSSNNSDTNNDIDGTNDDALVELTTIDHDNSSDKRVVVNQL
jgi:hypothetical protein